MTETDRIAAIETEIAELGRRANDLADELLRERSGHAETTARADAAEERARLATAAADDWRAASTRETQRAEDAERAMATLRGVHEKAMRAFADGRTVAADVAAQMRELAARLKGAL